jgi:hypothetical protein
VIEASTSQMRKLVYRALDGVEQLPASEQIDLHQAAALAFRDLDPKAAEDSAYIAHMQREAERLQLKFRELLRS